MWRRSCAALLGLAAAAASAQSPLGMGYVDAPDVRLIHPRPGLSYLVPHALGTFQQIQLRPKHQHIGPCRTIQR